MYMLPLYPVHALDARHQAKVLQVVRYHRQPIMEGCGPNKHIELADFAVKVFSDFFQSATNLAILFKHIKYMCQEGTSPSVIQIDFTHKLILAAILDSSLHACCIFGIISPTTCK